MDMRAGKYGKSISFLHRNFQMFINRELAEINVTSSEFVYFIILMRNNKIGFQDDFTDSLQIDKAAVARSLKSLEKKGFIIRELHPDNRRKKVVRLTEEGEKISWMIVSTIQKWNEMVERDIDPVDLEITIRVLKKMSDNISS